MIDEAVINVYVEKLKVCRASFSSQFKSLALILLLIALLPDFGL